MKETKGEIKSHKDVYEKGMSKGKESTSQFLHDLGLAALSTLFHRLYKRQKKVYF